MMKTLKTGWVMFVNFTMWFLKWTVIVGCIALAAFLYFKYHASVQTVYVNQTATSTDGCASNKELKDICNDPKFKKVEELRARKMLAEQKKSKIDAAYKAQTAQIEDELSAIRKEQLAIGAIESF